MKKYYKNSVLFVEEIYKADQLTVESGISEIELMENAGKAVASAVVNNFEKQQVIVLCGPGNNGGDGFVAARYLKEWGWPVRIGLSCEYEKLKNSALKNAKKCPVEIEKLEKSILKDLKKDNGIVIDALFGAGLNSEIREPAKELINIINDEKLTCVAVDLPSGINGNTGQVLGCAPMSKFTVTFFKRKIAHLLYPARKICGKTIVADIGIKEQILESINPKISFLSEENIIIPKRKSHDHKYTMGHSLIIGGENMTGAARLAARAARRVGAGLVTITSPTSAWSVYASDWPGNIVRKIDDIDQLQELIADSKFNSVLIGPGFGKSELLKSYIKSILKTKLPSVLDADALSVFDKNPDELFLNISDSCVLTPHEGEFKRLFPNLTGDKLKRALGAAKISNSIVVLKGADTVIASPDGYAFINENAPAYLATAGTGDVLSGMIAGLISQGLSALDAAKTAVWMHGESANLAGPSMIAEDLIEKIFKLRGKIIR